jgi:RNA 2',3'-cyclic 3'-phosphodiesterase
VSNRLFIGLELPANCRETLAALNPQIKGLRWLPADQLHLTMSFLGNVEASREEGLKTAFAQVRVPPFFLPIRGIGTFGGPMPTVVWAGVGSGHPHLFSLHRRLQDAVLHQNLEPDLKPFHPHITIGRARGVSCAALKPFLRQYEDTEFGLWQVTGFTLYSSALAADGPTYTVEMRQEF